MVAKQRNLIASTLSLAAIFLLVTFGTTLAADKLPAAQAGEIGEPEGQIAFLRDKNVWIMDATGGHQMMVTEVLNGDGRLSWSPDGNRVAFTRSGRVNMQGPDNLGGNHKVYDVFVAYIDSAKSGNTNFWYRITDGVGARDPEWSADGSTVIYWKDMNANFVNAFLPNYQVCIQSPPGEGTEDLLRQDWQTMTSFLISPSMNAAGDIAFVHMVKSSEGGFKPQGLAKLHKDSFMASMASIDAQSKANAGLVGPAWSPDGKWIACINNSMTDAGLYIVSADLSKKYLVFTPPPATSMTTYAPSFSPNSKWLTFGTRDGSVWICDITGGNTRRLTGPGLDAAPAWSKAKIK